MSPPYFIINPTAGNGKALSRWQSYLPLLAAAFPTMEWVASTASGNCCELARLAAAAGRRRIVAVGGDGTHHEVVNGLYDALGPDRLPEVTYALLPLGSGNDWIRTHRIPRRIEAWIARYRAGHTSLQNLGRIHYFDCEGRASQRIFTNVAGMAYDAYVVEHSAGSRLKTRWLYPLLTLAFLKAYQPPLLQLRYDSKQVVEQRFHTINVGIGRYSGGGMRLVPQADPRGDWLALTYARALSIPSILANGWRFYTAGIGRVKGVVCTQALLIEVKSPGQTEQLCVEADGEWLGYGPLKFELIPLALKFIS